MLIVVRTSARLKNFFTRLQGGPGFVRTPLNPSPPATGLHLCKIIFFTDLDLFIQFGTSIVKELIPESEIARHVARQLLKESARFGGNRTISTSLLKIAELILANQLPHAYLQYITKAITHLTQYVTQNAAKGVSEVGKAALKNGGTKEAAKKVITEKVMTQVTSKQVPSTIVDEGGKKVVKKASELVTKKVSKEVVEETGKMMAEKGTEVVAKGGRKMLAKGAEASAKGAAKGVAGETAKHVSLKVASKAGWECAKKVPKQALVCGVVVDTVISTAEICHAYKKLRDGEIDQREFCCRSVRSVSSGVGSTAGGVGGATLGTYIGATIGTIFVPGAGTTFGGAVGGFLGSVLGGTGGAMAGGHVGEFMTKN